MSATLRDVAREAGVHTATAARALSPATQDKVAPATRHKVEQAVRKLGYTANAAAASLRTGRSGFVGMLVPDLANPLFAPLLKSAEQRLRQRGWTLLLAQVDPGDPDRLAALRTLVAKQVDGLIVATSQHDDPMLDMIHQRKIPAVLVNRGFGERRFACVVNDDSYSMQLAVSHLHGLGHQHLLHLGGPANSSTGQARAEAFARWAGDPGEVLLAGQFTREAGFAAMQAYLARSARRRPATGVIAANDLIAVGAMQAIAQAGLRVPQDLSVIGHNDTLFMDLVMPALTTVRVPVDQMGQEAADLLAQAMTQASDFVPATRLLHPDLVVRASTARRGRAPG